MGKFLLLILSLSLSISSVAQTIENDCDCDITITSEDQNFPYATYDQSKNKTICFKGDFDFELNWKKLGNNVTLCIGEDVKFESDGLEFEESKTIYNYGEFEYDHELILDQSSSVINYGKMESKFNFDGGFIKNLNDAKLKIEGYSNFNSGNLFSDSESELEIKQNRIIIGEYMSFEVLDDFEFDGDFDNNGTVKFGGEVEIEKSLTNSGSFIADNDVKIKGSTNNSGTLSISGESEFEENVMNKGTIELYDEAEFGEDYASDSDDAKLIAYGFLEIDGDVNLQKGYLEANQGLVFDEDTQIKENARLKFMGEASFEDLTLSGEIFTDFGNNILKIDDAGGYGGQIIAIDPSSIFIEDLNDLPDNWNLTGNISDKENEDDSKVVIWLGKESSDTNNKNNWSGNIKKKNNILILKTQNQPIINKKLEVKSVFVNPDAKLTNLNVLEIEGDLKIEGEFNSREGSIEMKGKQTQTLSFKHTTEIGSLIIDNKKDNVELLEGNIDIFKNIELVDGNLITGYLSETPDNNLITFKSDSDQTAILSEVKGNSKIIGAVRIERYLPSSNRAYRYLSSSVNSIGSINDDWQEGVNNTVNNYNSNKNPNPSYGTHITGNKSGQNGLDASLTGNSSMFTWNLDSGSWEPITNTIDQKLEVGKSYSILIRGDRSTNIYSSNSAYTGSTTLRSTGEIVTGNVDVSQELNKTPDGFTLLGNPYQAQVDLKKALKESSSHLNQESYYAWTPKLQTRGGYVTVDLESEPVEYIPSVKSTTSSNEEDFRYIQPNQSVFLKTSPTADDQNPPTLVFKEEHKTNSITSNEVFSVPEQIGKIDLTLIRKKDNQVVDGVRFKLNDNFINEVNKFDATKLWNSEESFSILANETSYLAIERRRFPEVDETLKFWIGNYTGQEYTMLVEVTDIENFKIYLKDNYTEETTELENGDNEIDFNVDSSISESVASDRFELAFEPETLNIQDNELDNNNIQLYPNPSSTGIVYLKHQNTFNGDVDIELFSMAGQKVNVSSEPVSNSELKINTSSLSTGVYLVRLSHGQQSTTRKLIIQ
jgi:hypothetical protein